MKQEELDGIWNYYLSLERDLSDTSSYVEPIGQEEVYSFEFAKIIILSCTEFESVAKCICRENGTEKGDISGYKSVIIQLFPKIVDGTISIKRLGRTIQPFEGWKTGGLKWWDVYQHIKHSRGTSYTEASYINAVTSLGALYLLIFFLAYQVGLSFDDCKSEYITSEYQHKYLIARPDIKVPDFSKGGMVENKTIYFETT